jgi:hypothetical protein
MMLRYVELELIQKSDSTQIKKTKKHLTTPNSLSDSEIMQVRVIDEDMFNGFKLIMELEI